MESILKSCLLDGKEETRGDEEEKEYMCKPYPACDDGVCDTWTAEDVNEDRWQGAGGWLCRSFFYVTGHRRWERWATRKAGQFAEKRHED